MKLLNKYQTVKEFKFRGDLLCILTGKHIAFDNFIIEGEFRCFKFWNKYLLYQNSVGSNLMVFDMNKKEIIKEFSGAVEYVLWFLNQNNQIPIDEKVFILKENLDLIETMRIEFPRYCNEKYAVDRFKNTVECTEVYKGDLIWKFELGDNVKVGGDFILMDKLVVVSTNTQNLIGIEIETGKELWRLSNCNLHHQQQPTTNYLVGLSANSFGDNFYQVIDPINGVKLIDKKFENFFYETIPNLACITETHYYFISNVLGDGTGTKSERITYLGCINIQTHEIEWVERIVGSGFLKPEVHNNKFYLLDGEQTLHIYETA
jgi:outer membrane protein assembly factor BamB